MQTMPVRSLWFAHVRRAAILAIAIGLGFAAAPTAHAASIAVTTTADSLAADGKCSLREAIRAVNAQTTIDTCAGAGSDQITLPAATYTLGIAGQDEDAAASGDLDLTRTVTIAAAGAAATVIDGNSLDRVFDIRAGTATLTGVTIQHGRADSGGGIRNAGTLYLTKTTVKANTADNFSGGGALNLGKMYLQTSSILGNIAAEEGGGVDNQGTLQANGSVISGNDNVDGSGGGFDNRGTLILLNTRVTGNSSDGPGAIRNLDGGVVQITRSVIADNLSSLDDIGTTGGIANGGALTITDSTISGNHGPLVGGISNAGSLTLLGSTVSGNISDDTAGGIGNSGMLTATNSTISGNRAKGDGGGLLSVAAAARASLLNVTIAENQADEDDDGEGQGGGIAILAGTVAMTNTVLAGNRAGPAQASNCTGAPTSYGHNAIADASGCTLTGSGIGDLLGVDPQLGQLAPNGGATATQALLPGSPLIDVGDAAACPATDQRGTARPADGDGDDVAVCDIGAYERRRSENTYLPLIAR